ncbi:hypothetical protein FRIGORI9N_540013 [Frigoribacterium sp. 9N]|nr:hypothetical protein FRIGORI9N_540013 [Frigoribacterium sp. 9N]
MADPAVGRRRGGGGRRAAARGPARLTPRPGGTRRGTLAPPAPRVLLEACRSTRASSRGSSPPFCSSP